MNPLYLSIINSAQNTKWLEARLIDTEEEIDTTIARLKELVDRRKAISDRLRELRERD